MNPPLGVFDPGPDPFIAFKRAARARFPCLVYLTRRDDLVHASTVCAERFGEDAMPDVEDRTLDRPGAWTRCGTVFFFTSEEERACFLIAL